MSGLSGELWHMARQAGMCGDDWIIGGNSSNLVAFARLVAEDCCTIADHIDENSGQYHDNVPIGAAIEAIRRKYGLSGD